MFKSWIEELNRTDWTKAGNTILKWKPYGGPLGEYTTAVALTKAVGLDPDAHRGNCLRAGVETMLALARYNETNNLSEAGEA